MGLTHTGKQQGWLWTTGGRRRCAGSKNRGHRERTNGTRRNHHSPGTPTTGLRERGNATSRSTGRSGRQNAATRRNMRREERVTVQGPVKEPQPDGMSHGGSAGPTCTRAVGEGLGEYHDVLDVCAGAGRGVAVPEICAREAWHIWPARSPQTHDVRGLGIVTAAS